jgi:hypothetical protein
MNPIKLTIKGVAVEVSSPEDAMRMIELSQETGQTRPANGSGASQANPGTPAHDPSAADPQAIRIAIDFLKAIQNGGQGGIGTEKIISALGVPHGRAIGGRLAIINRLLEERQFSKGQVYSNKKTANGRVWKSRKGIEAAITAMDQYLKTVQ